MRRAYHAALLFGAAMLGGLPADASAGAVTFTGSDEQLTITHFVDYLREHGTELSLPEAMARFEEGAYSTGTNSLLDLGVIQDGVWLAMTIENRSLRPDMVLELRNPRISHVDFYMPQENGTFKKFETGTARPFFDRDFWHPMPAFELAIAPGERKTYFMRVYNTGNMRLKFWLWNTDRFQERIMVAYNPELITIGIILSLALFHFLVFLALFIPSYLYLSLFLSSWLLFFMSLNGTGPMLLWPDSPWLGERAPTLFTVLMSATFTAFVTSLLEARKHAPVLYRVAVGVTLMCLVAFLYASLNQSIWRIHVVTLLAVSTSVVTIALAIRVAMLGNRTALLFLCLWGILLVSTLGFASIGLYVMPEFVKNGYVINLMFIGSILLWSFELTGRVKSRILQEKNYLEEKVNERTQDLQEALLQVKTLRGLLPICSSCKKIRDDQGEWASIEHYIVTKTEADLTHGICPECCKSLYPELHAEGVFDETQERPSGKPRAQQAG